MSCCDFKNIFILSDAFGKTDSNIFDKSAWSLSDTKISSLSQVDFSERFLGPECSLIYDSGCSSPLAGILQYTFSLLLVSFSVFASIFNFSF